MLLNAARVLARNSSNYWSGSTCLEVMSEIVDMSTAIRSRIPTVIIPRTTLRPESMSFEAVGQSAQLLDLPVKFHIPCLLRNFRHLRTQHVECPVMLGEFLFEGVFEHKL